MKNLVEGGILVIVVLLFMLGSFRAGLITAMAIPLSMLFATNLMQSFGITASLMSLGAIDFGLIVDSSVIMVENCIHRLSHNTENRSRTEVIRDAAIEVRKPTMFGELIISIVYLPILMLEGTEGKLFRPMALTVLFALFGSLILSMTFMPAMASLALPRRMTGTRCLAGAGDQMVYRRSSRGRSPPGRHGRSGCRGASPSAFRWHAISELSSCRGWKKATCWSKRFDCRVRRSKERSKCRHGLRRNW